MKKILLAMVLVSGSLMAADAAATFTKVCASCHGQKGEKKALGKSEIIDTWKSAQIEDALKAYKAGTRNTKGMGGLMKSKVATMSDADIKALSAYIPTLK